VAPEWSFDEDTGYGYTSEEQAVVLDVLRDLRNRFNVDSDRVFLFGLGQGANLAYDVGLSHPDLFAGVLTMGGQPRWHAGHYWPNAQALPFYVVEGTHNGKGPKYNRDQFKHWVSGHYPSLYVEYKGRGPEWFGGELSHMFDWMGVKKRSHPRSLGDRDDFRSMREADNRFYWVSTESITKGSLNDAGRLWRTPNPARFEAHIGTGNFVYVSTRGVKDVTIWFAPAMIDFEKNVKFKVNGSVPKGIKTSGVRISPSAAVLLEDFYQRGDKQYLFLAKKTFLVK
jgi:pimeloyl-ACP methyl ester carboxylesterase